MYNYALVNLEYKRDGANTSKYRTGQGICCQEFLPCTCVSVSLLLQKCGFRHIYVACVNLPLNDALCPCMYVYRFTAAWGHRTWDGSP